MFKRLLEKLRKWLHALLQILFPGDMLAQIRESMRGADPQGSSPGGGDGPAEHSRASAGAYYGSSDHGTPGRGSGTYRALEELTEEERRRMKASPVERRHILFFGHVQGVGFRYYAMSHARAYGLTGWVENLPDGSVEMEVQGPAAMIDHALLALGDGRWIRIESMDVRQIPVVKDERGFRVRGY